MSTSFQSVSLSPAPFNYKVLVSQESGASSILRGVDKLARAVNVTLGPKGRNVVIQRASGSPTFTKDGATVAREITLSDPLENLGVALVREVALKTSDVGGDGTTTSTVLANAILRGAMKMITAGASATHVKISIDNAVALVIKELKLSAWPAENRNVSRIAAIAANNDLKIGALVTECLQKIGKDGAVSVEESSNVESELHFFEGMRIKTGYVSSYFVTDSERMRVMLDDPYVLVSEDRIGNLGQIQQLLEKIVAANRSLLIIAAAVEGEALAMMVTNKLRETLKICAISMPANLQSREWKFEDLRLITGATPISATGVSLKKVHLAELGRARRVIVNKNSTSIIGGLGAREEVSRRIVQIREQIISTTSIQDRESLQERMSNLSGGSAIISVGAPTETELAEKKACTEGAMHAARAAMESGVVLGGGTGLFRAAKKVSEEVRAKGNLEADLGIRIVTNACEEVIRQLAWNAGFDGAVVVHLLRELSNPHFGFNVISGRFENFYRNEIIDPLKTVELALLHASSISTALASAGAYLFKPNTHQLFRDQTRTPAVGIATRVLDLDVSLTRELDTEFDQLGQVVPVIDEQVSSVFYDENAIFGFVDVPEVSEGEKLIPGRSYTLHVGLTRDLSSDTSSESIPPRRDVHFTAKILINGALLVSNWHEEGVLLSSAESCSVPFQMEVEHVPNVSVSVNLYHLNQWIASLPLTLDVTAQ